jgi:hypothetical protein
VPIDAIEFSGAATRPMKKMYMIKSPSVIRRDNRAAAQPDHQHADDTDDDGAAGVGGRNTGQRLRDVAKQPVRALGEDDLLALLAV